MESPENPFDKLYQEITSGYNNKGIKLGKMFNNDENIHLKTSDGEKEIVPELIKEALEETNKQMVTLYGEAKEEIARYTLGKNTRGTHLGFFKKKYKDGIKKFVIRIQIAGLSFYNKHYCNNKENWEKANQYELSPKLYFYKEVDAKDFNMENPNMKLICIVNEAFDMNLHTLIKDYYTPKLKKNDNIANKMVSQITDLYTIMVKNMNMICFDIKLENMVIRYENVTDENNPDFTIKLIDWDSDWCMIPDTFWNREIKFEGTVINKEEKKDIIIMLILMFVANYFYIQGNNIFSENIKSFANKSKNTEKMRLIFKEDFTPEPSKKQDDISFEFKAKYYFGRRLDPDISPDKLFDHILTHALLKDSNEKKDMKKKNKKKAAVKAPPAAAAPAAMDSEHKHTGGKKNKRKTKRKYKTKTKNVRNKKKKRTRKKR